MSKIKELERENARMKKQLEKNKWIPVESEKKPYLYQKILVTYECDDGFKMLSVVMYFGDFDRPSAYKALAWMPAPDLYTPPTDESVKDGREE